MKIGSLCLFSCFASPLTYLLFLALMTWETRLSFLVCVGGDIWGLVNSRWEGSKCLDWV